MSVRTILICVLALVFGVSAAAWVNTLRRAPQSAETETETIAIVVAAADVPRFTTVSTGMLAMRNFPKELVPPGSFTRIEDAQDRVAITPIIKGEPILTGRLSARGAGRGMAAAVPPKMRAFTIQTPNVSAGVAGFILPGNKVDVLLTINDSNERTGGATTLTLLQNAEILAVDQRVEAPTDYKVDATQLRSVTLLVTPDDAARLNLGQNKGTLHLSLRNPHDRDSARARPATVKELRAQLEKENPETPRMSQWPSAPVLAAAAETNLSSLQPPAPVWVTTISRGPGPDEMVSFFKDGRISRSPAEATPPESGKPVAIPARSPSRK